LFHHQPVKLYCLVSCVSLELLSQKSTGKQNDLAIQRMSSPINLILPKTRLLNYTIVTVNLTALKAAATLCEIICNDGHGRSRSLKVKDFGTD